MGSTSSFTPSYAVPGSAPAATPPYPTSGSASVPAVSPPFQTRNLISSSATVSIQQGALDLNTAPVQVATMASTSGSMTTQVGDVYRTPSSRPASNIRQVDQRVQTISSASASASVPFRPAPASPSSPESPGSNESPSQASLHRRAGRKSSRPTWALPDSLNRQQSTEGIRVRQATTLTGSVTPPAPSATVVKSGSLQMGAAYDTKPVVNAVMPTVVLDLQASPENVTTNNVVREKTAEFGGQRGSESSLFVMDGGSSDSDDGTLSTDHHKLAAEVRQREEELRESLAMELMAHSQFMVKRSTQTGPLRIEVNFADKLGGDMISRRQGAFKLSAPGESVPLEGNYMFNNDHGTLYVGEDIAGSFTCARVGPLPRKLGNANIPCIMLHDSEVMKEIQNPENQGAVFVLPSQLNGAEYPSDADRDIIAEIEDYKSDNTGGPRGQLAVHPAAGQFMLDNAANARSPSGINAVAQVLPELNAAGFAFELVNGYLKVPPIKYEDMDAVMTILRQELANLRILLMEDVPACGLTPDKRYFCKVSHRVNLIYASAVPVQAYLNAGRPDQEEFQVALSEAFIFAQYYGALKAAAQPHKHLPGQRVKVFLMPLGGGVFNNPWTTIAAGISQAVEALSHDERARLDIRALTWSGNPGEKDTLATLLRDCGKLLS